MTNGLVKILLGVGVAATLVTACTKEATPTSVPTEQSRPVAIATPTPSPTAIMLNHILNSGVPSETKYDPGSFDGPYDVDIYRGTMPSGESVTLLHYRATRNPFVRRREVEERCHLIIGGESFLDGYDHQDVGCDGIVDRTNIESGLWPQEIVDLDEKGRAMVENRYNAGLVALLDTVKKGSSSVHYNKVNHNPPISIVQRIHPERFTQGGYARTPR